MVIARDDMPVVRLVAVADRRPFGLGLPEARVPRESLPDFFEPLPGEDLHLWDGGWSLYLLVAQVRAWSLTRPRLLPPPALATVAGGLPLMLGPVAFHAVALRVRQGKWPEVAGLAATAPTLFAERGGLSVPVAGDVAIAAKALDRPRRDPFGRLISTTALCHT